MLDTIPISAINQYAYCPRRCYLIHAEQSFADNIHTLRGTAEHERADTTGHETRPSVRIERALPVFSEQLGLSGRCDVVEFWEDGTAYPVEYKHGKRRRWINDDLQLAAQMLCLAEMLGRPVARGAICHIQSRRRREVALTEELITQVKDAVRTTRELLLKDKPPAPTTQVQRCDECSLHGLCQPEAFLNQSRLAAHRAAMFDCENEEGVSRG